MLTTIQIVDLLRHTAVNRGHKPTDYAVAKIMAANNNVVTKWTKSGGTMNDINAARAAQILDLEPEYLIACLNAERAKGTETYEFWKRICKRLEGDNMKRARTIAA